MRIFKGLENIHSVIDRHQAEWLREQGEEPEQHKLPSVEERIRQRFAEGASSGSGRFSADRFLGVSAGAESHEPEPEPEIHEEHEPAVEVVNVIPQKEERHSWLYKEVLKAINDAAGDRKNTKVIAVFIPVVQNGKEFESLPVDDTVTIQTVNIDEPDHEAEQPVHEPVELTKAEPEEQPSVSEEFNLLPEGPAEPDAELAEAFQTIEENLDETLQESQEESEPESERESEQEAQPEPEENIAEVPDEPADDLLQVPEESDSEPEQPEIPEIPGEGESDELDDILISEGEPLEYQEIGEIEEPEEPEEIQLPESLEDNDEIFDDAIFEEPLETSDEETIIIEDPELRKD